MGDMKKRLSAVIGAVCGAALILFGTVGVWTSNMTHQMIDAMPDIHVVGQGAATPICTAFIFLGAGFTSWGIYKLREQHRPYPEIDHLLKNDSEAISKSLY